MIDKIQSINEQDQQDIKEEDDELKMNKHYHIDEMLGFPSLLDKIRLRIEDQDDSFPQVRSRRQTNDELQSPSKKMEIQKENQLKQQEFSEIRSKQVTYVQKFNHRKKGGSYDTRQQKGGVISNYKKLEQKFILDLNSREDMHDLYTSINEQKKTEMLLIMIKRSLGQLDIFRDIEQNLKSQNYVNLIRSLKTQIVKQGSTIFSFGSVGKQYYFLIKGQVYILLRTALGSRISSLEKLSQAQQQEQEREKQQSERKRKIEILKKRDSTGEIAAQSVITTTQKKTQFLTYANKLQSAASKITETLENSQENSSPKLSPQKSLWDSPILNSILKKQPSAFQQESNILSSSQTPGLQYLLQLQQNDSKRVNFDDTRSQRSLEDKISITWSVDSIRNKEEIKKKFPHFQIVGTHNSGDGFGELSLLKGIKRTATIVAKEDCFFLTLDKESYLNYLAEYHEKIYKDKINFVKQFFIFEQLDKRLPSLIILFEPKTYTSGQIIYQPGDEVNYFYLIKKGNVSLSRKIIQKTERELIKKVEEKDSVANKYLRELQIQKQIQQQQKNSICLEHDSEVASKSDFFNDFTNQAAYDPEWDGKKETEDNKDDDQVDIKDLIYSEEKGAFVGKDQKILTMMRSSPSKDRNLIRNNSQSPKKNTLLTIMGEVTYFGEEEILSKEKFRQYEAKATSSKVEILRISTKNLKIISKYNDVMQRIKVFCGFKNEWRHNYVERSQNALLIQEYMTKNFKDFYTKNFLNKDKISKASVEITAKNVPDSMKLNKQTQSVLNRRLYIRQKSKSNKQKQTLNTHSDINDTQFTQQNQKKVSSEAINYNKFSSKSPEKHASQIENQYHQKKFSTASPNKRKSNHHNDLNNPTVDISCIDSKESLSIFNLNNSTSKSINKLQKEYIQMNVEQREQDSKSKDIQQQIQYKKQKTESPEFIKNIQSTKSQAQQNLQQNQNSQQVQPDKPVSSQKLIKINKASNTFESPTSIQNLSIEDLRLFQTQQKYIKEQKKLKLIKSGTFNINNEGVNYDPLQMQSYFSSPKSNNVSDSSPELKQITERQANKLAQEKEQQQMKVQNEEMNFQKEQAGQMEKLRDLLTKEKTTQKNKKIQEQPQQQSNQDLNFREIHRIFINIEGIKSKKQDKYTRQYRDAQEMFDKDHNKKRQTTIISKFDQQKSSDIINHLKQKQRSNSQYNKQLSNQIENLIPNLSHQRPKSNSISQSNTQPQRIFSFRDYLDKQKPIQIDGSSFQQFNLQKYGDNEYLSQNTTEIKHFELSINNKNYQTSKSLGLNLEISQKKGLIYIEQQQNNKIETIPTQTNSNKNISRVYRTDDTQSDNVEEDFDTTQNYYFQKVPSYRFSTKSQKETNKQIPEKNNQLILHEDQQKMNQQKRATDQKQVKESDIDQVRNMLLLVKKLKIDQLMDTKNTDLPTSSGLISRSMNIISAPTTARSVSQNKRRKKSTISDKKPSVINLNMSTNQESKLIGQGITQLNINKIKEEPITGFSLPLQIFNMTQRESQQRRKSSGTIFRPSVPSQRVPIKSQQNQNNQSFIVHSKYQNFHHI